jgi:molybdopterin converting factor small subunit
MSLTIKTLRPLAEWIGGKKIEMEWPGGTLEDLIRALIEKAGPEIEKELKNEEGSLAYIVSINGKIERKPSTAIHDGDEIFFFTPLGGG